MSEAFQCWINNHQKHIWEQTWILTHSKCVKITSMCRKNILFRFFKKCFKSFLRINQLFHSLFESIIGCLMQWSKLQFLIHVWCDESNYRFLIKRLQDEHRECYVVNGLMVEAACALTVISSSNQCFHQPWQHMIDDRLLKDHNHFTASFSTTLFIKFLMS